MNNIPCRCCGRQLRADWQPGLASHPGYHLLTCDQPDCALHGYTFGSPDYHEIDLAPYYATAEKRGNAGQGVCHV